MLRVSLCLLLVAAAGCRTPKPLGGGSAAPVDGGTASSSTLDSAPAASSTSLGPGDLVEIRVFEEKELSDVWRLSSEGLIDYPLCGKISLLGLDQTAAAEKIRKCLEAGFIKRPQVSVVVREYNSKKIFVIGEVNKPGTFPFEDNMTIIQAVTLAGGFTKLAAQNSTSVTRIVDGQEKKIRVPVQEIGTGREKNFPLLPGDIVFVPESFF